MYILSQNNLPSCVVVGVIVVVVVVYCRAGGFLIGISSVYIVHMVLKLTNGRTEGIFINKSRCINCM